MQSLPGAVALAMGRQMLPNLRRLLILWLGSALLCGCLQPVADPTGNDIAPEAAGARFGPGDVSSLDIPLAADAYLEPLDTAAPPDSEEMPVDVTQPDAGPGGDGTTAVDGGPDCGNGSCAGPETCASCPADCGPCAMVCGNQTCDANETCVNCAADCGACPPPLCDVLSSKGCEANQQCYPDGKANLCYAAGMVAPGELCKAFNDCAVGALCVAGLCRQVCDFTGKNALGLCKPGVPCEKLVFSAAGDVGQNLGACKPAEKCDPLLNTGCAGGQNCAPYGWFKSCLPVGTGQDGQACSGPSGCGLGLLCVAQGVGGGICRKPCNTNGGAPACNTGTCHTLLGPDSAATPGFVGWCGP